MPERRQLRESEGPEGRSKRPAMGRGQTRAGLQRPCVAYYGAFTHRKPMWFVALEISPLPRVPTM
jgi:hypothetical protein